MVVPVQNPAVIGYFEPAVKCYSDIVVYWWYESLMKLLLLFSLLIQIALATLLSHVKIIMIYWHNLVLQIKITTCVYTYYVSYQLADIYSIIRTPMLHPWMKVTVTFELPFFIIACTSRKQTFCLGTIFGVTPGIFWTREWRRFNPGYTLEPGVKVAAQRCWLGRQTFSPS